MTSLIGSDIIVGEDILVTRRDEDTNTILAQTGDVIAEETQSQESVVWQHSGFCSRPPNAIAGKSSAQAIVLRSSQYDAIVATRDLASQQMYGLLNEGESCLYAAGPDGQSQARVLCKSDGSINLVTTDTNTPKGKTLIHSFSPEGLQIATPWGGIVLNSEGIKMYTNDTSGHMNGWIELKPSGEVVVAATSFKCPSGNVALGLNATSATPAAYGAGVPVPSSCVFVSP